MGMEPLFLSYCVNRHTDGHEYSIVALIKRNYNKFGVLDRLLPITEFHGFTSRIDF